MKNVTLKAGNEQDFFRRGKVLARLADAGQPMPEERTVSFEDPADLLRLLTASRLDVFRSVKGEPGSITVIAQGPLQAALCSSRNAPSDHAVLPHCEAEARFDRLVLGGIASRHADPQRCR